MKYIFVTLKIADLETDLKIPSDMNPSELVSVAAKTYKINVPASAKLQAEPLGRKRCRALYGCKTSVALRTGVFLVLFLRLQPPKKEQSKAL